MNGGEKSDAGIVAVKPTNKVWKTTWRSGWSEGAHPRGNCKPQHVPDTEPGSRAIVVHAPDAGPGSWVPGWTSWEGHVRSLTLCGNARPDGGAGCANAHVRICAGPPGRLGATAIRHCSPFPHTIYPDFQLLTAYRRRYFTDFSDTPSSNITICVHVGISSFGSSNVPASSLL